MKKRMLSAALAGAMVLSMGSAVFADELTTPTDGAYKQDVTVTNEVNVPTISIDVPTTATVVINPYKLAYDIDGTEYTDVMANVEQTITNKSDVPIAISATVKAAPSAGSEAVLATAALKGTETTKSVFAYLEIKEKDAADGAAAFSDAYDSKAANQVAFTVKDVTKSSMVTLPAGDTNNTFAGFKVFGGAASKPTKAWTAADTIDFSMTFNFQPVVAETP